MKENLLLTTLKLASDRATNDNDDDDDDAI